MKKPVIAITLDHHINANGFSYSERPWYALRCDYSRVVASLGGLPIFLPYEYDLINDALDIADGLIIPGGDYHIPPRFYGYIDSEIEHGEVRAEYELALLEKAIDRNMPILGICNGMQALNVCLGGTLSKNVPNHLQPSPKNVPYHNINIENGTKIAELAGALRVEVNSTHTQAVEKLGNGLIVSAKADDGIIEAIESVNHDFVVGVEWHPEHQNSKLDENLFKSLLYNAARI